MASSLSIINLSKEIECEKRKSKILTNFNCHTPIKKVSQNIPSSTIVKNKKSVTFFDYETPQERKMSNFNNFKVTSIFYEQDERPVIEEEEKEKDRDREKDEAYVKRRIEKHKRQQTVKFRDKSTNKIKEITVKKNSYNNIRASLIVNNSLKDLQTLRTLRMSANETTRKNTKEKSVSDFQLYDYNKINHKKELSTASNNERGSLISFQNKIIDDSYSKLRANTGKNITNFKSIDKINQSDQRKTEKKEIFTKTQIDFLKDLQTKKESNAEFNQIKRKKVMNVFKKGISKQQKKNGYIEKIKEPYDFYLINSKVNSSPFTKPYVFEFNYEKRLNDDPLQQFKEEYLDQKYRPVDSKIKFYNSKIQNNILKQVSVTYKSKI